MVSPGTYVVAGLYRSSWLCMVRDMECNDSREPPRPGGNKYGLLMSISIDMPRPRRKAFSPPRSAATISGLFFLPFLVLVRALLAGSQPKSKDLCGSLASSWRSFLTCFRWK